jgi:hypothetical protein
MIAVAVVALLLGGGLEWERQRRRRSFREMADACAKEAAEWRAEAERKDREAPYPSGIRGGIGHRRAAIYRELAARRFEAAASQTWPPSVGWSPPEPE